MCGLGWPAACGILVPRPGVEPSFPALQRGFLTTGPPGKSPYLFLKLRFNWWITLYKAYNIDLIHLFHNIIATAVIANTSVISHSYIFFFLDLGSKGALSDGTWDLNFWHWKCIHHLPMDAFLAAGDHCRKEERSSFCLSGNEKLAAPEILTPLCWYQNAFSKYWWAFHWPIHMF